MDIAIIGVAGRFPEAKNIEELYHNLKTGRDSARHISIARLRATTMPIDQKYKVFSWLDNIDKFDHKFFNLSLAEAQNMDPHQRFVLEVVYEMFESSGYNIDDFHGSNTAIFSGDVTLKYFELAKKFDPTLITGNTNASTIGHIARAFNLRGAAMMIDTNCSSTLVAANLACKEIECGDADHAIVCGARLVIEPRVDDESEGDDLGIMTGDGKTKSFSAAADGTGAGEAVASILLKPLEKAQKDNDIIYGIIKGSAVNQEAQLSGSLTAPSSLAQSEVIKKAWKKAAIDPLSIAYIEPHGSGTKLGDPIEIEGIDLAYKGLGATPGEIMVSAVKTNIGHTDTVAGLSGLIKVLLSFKHQEFFGSLHFDAPNPFIDFEKSVTYINTENKPWKKKEHQPRRAGLSSFGLSGTNAHLVLEEAAEIGEDNFNNAEQIITISGKSEKALKANISALKDFLIEHPETAMANISHTLNRGRKHYDYRYATVKDNLIELIGELMQNEDNNFALIKPLKQLCFIFSDEVITDEKQIQSFLKNETFKLVYQECLKGNETEDKVKSFAFQYAYYKLLEGLGINTKNVLGIGLGRAVVDVIAGQKTMAEGIEIAKSCQKNDVLELNKRLESLVEREAIKGKVAFVEIGTESTLIKGLKELAIENKENLYTALPLSSLNNLLLELYFEGYGIDWEKAHPITSGRKIKLPSYQFDAIRCWLREEGDDRIFEREISNTSSSNNQEIRETNTKIEINKNWSSTEQIIARFWVEVLKLDKIHLEDDFFKLGGHSLIATQLIARIESKFGCRLQFKNVAVFSTVKLLSQAVDELVDKGEDLFKTQINKAPDAANYPLSNAQIRLWILDQLEEDNVNYNLPGAMVMTGKISIEKFENAIKKVIERHESLRTSFDLIEGKAVQIISETSQFSIVQSNCNENELEKKIADFVHPFELNKAPLLRVEISQFASDKYLFLFDIHHIISDGISQDLLMRDFLAFYKGFELPKLEIQYKDYSVWQNELFESGSMLAQEKYWMGRFSDELPTLTLPYDFQRPLIKSFKGSKYNFRISVENTKNIKLLARESGVTPYMMLLAVYNILLSKYSGQEDIIIGSPIAGRSHEAFEPILGMFVNTLAMRNFPEGKRTFHNFLEEVKFNSTEAYANQDYPFESLVDQLNLEKDLGRSPMFDTMFSFQSSFNSEKSEVFDEEELSIEPFPFIGNSAKFDIVTEIFDREDYFNINVEYCIDLFKAETIENFMKQYEKIIEQIVKNPMIKLADITVLDEEERERILTHFNDTNIDFEIQQPINLVFEQVAKKFKNNPALCFKNQTLTYQQLNEQVNQVAHTLIEKGLGQGDIVAVVTEPSIEMIVATWGVIKAGAIYLPIDHQYPVERIEAILDKSNARILLSNVPDLTCQTNKREHLNLLDATKFSSNQSNPVTKTTLEDVAYVIFTSGSTGEPKGVEVQHKALLNSCYWHIKECDFSENDNSSKYAGFGFDASILEIFPNFMVGACLHIIPSEMRLELSELAVFFNQHKISIAFLPTQIAERYLHFENETLNVLFIGGDKIKRFQNTNYLVKNYYGPSENTVVTSCFTIDKAYDNIPIGKPIANNKVYILDQQLQPLPIGVVGELYISGENLAKGYLNNPEETAEKFLSNPFIEGERIYKSGDLAKWDENGTLLFFGRVDDQVKIRGNRVELGEVEKKIMEFPTVENAVVVTVENNEGTLRMSAYLVATDKLEMKDVKTFLAQQLPDYMVPSFIQQLDTIPLNANGKINKKALPDIKGNLSLSSFIKPSSELEIELAKIWCTILEIDQVGVTTSFFEIGGHSLSAATLLGQVHKELGHEIKLRQFFKTPTIAGIIEVIKAGASSKFVAINTVDIQEKYAVSAAQQRMYLLHKLNTSSSVYNLPGVIKIKGKINNDRLDIALQQLVQRHDSLRTYFEEDVESIYQIIKDEITFNIDFKVIRNAEVSTVVEQFIQPFNLKDAPLFRVALASITKEEHVLMFDMHHIISDGTSVEILIAELAALYDQQELDVIRLQYKDFSHWQNQLFQTESFQKQENFWVNYISAHPPLLDLPTDYSRPAELSREGKNSVFQLSKERTEGLKAISRTFGCTDFMTLLAAFNVLLHKYTTQEDIIVGTPIAGRHHADLQNIVGMFVNTLAIRNFPLAEQSFDTFLHQLKENTLRVFEHQDYQFDRLVEQLNLTRDTSRNPIFDIMFIYQNIESKQIGNSEIGNWQIEPYQFESNVSKFDLTFDVRERKDGFLINIEYSVELFKEETIQQFFKHFSVIVDAIIANKNVLLKDISLTSKKEQQLLLSAAIQQNKTIDFSVGIQNLFEDIVIKQFNETAISFGEENITFDELNRKVNQMAHYLRGLGIKPNDTVAILVPRSINTIVALFAVIKSGAAYIAIDSNYPQKRIDYILKDSQSKIIITEDSLSKKIPKNIQIIDVNDPEINQQRTANLSMINQPEDLAYVVYTSGSTGKPKGVAIAHKNLTTFINWCNVEFNRSTFDVVFAGTSFSFDLSIFEIFYALQNGKRVRLLNSAIEIEKYLKIEQNVLINTVPSVILELLEQGVSLDTVTVLNMAGEPIPLSIKETLNFEKIEVRNLYGPSEDTTYSTCYRLKEANSKQIIGKAICNTNLFILDKNGNLCPNGILGELYISGDGLAMGYYNQHELTQEKFTNNFLDKRRLYQTGDLAKKLTDGNIEYLGRIDDQVKIRGYRIELGEIENALKTMNLISEVAVIDQTVYDNKVLCAYYISEDVLSNSIIQEHLKEALPAYMVPDFFVRIEKIPLTPNGKVDKKAFPAPLIEQKEQIKPRTKTERKVAEIWQRILKVNHDISITDNFFELGGHSLKASSLVSTIHKAFDVIIPLITVFKKPTIELLAALIDTVEKKKHTSIEPIKEKEFYPLSAAQKRIYVLNQFAPESSRYNMSLAIEIGGKVKKAKFESTFKILINRHESLRTSFQLKGKEIVQIVNNTVSFNIDYKEVSGIEVEKQIEAFIRPFNLSDETLLRVLLLKVTDQKHIMVIDLHHIITDGVSMQILTDEFVKVYDNVELERLRLQYKDYSNWQNQLFQSDGIKVQEQYWLNQFQGELPVLNLVTDYPRPALQRFEGNTIGFRIDEKMTNSIKSLAGTYNTTTYMLLLAVYNILLSKHSRQDDIIIGTPIAGRPHTDLQNIIGMFVNTLALRSNPSANKVFKDFLNELTQNTLSAFDNMDFPFEELVEKLELERVASRNPLFDTMFSFISETQPVEGLNVLSLTPYEVENGTTKFDLQLDVIDCESFIQLGFNYSTSLFNKDTVERFSDHFNAILKSVVENPLITIGQIDYISQTEKEKIQFDFNATTHNFDEGSTLNELFEKQAAKTPDAIALKYEADTLTYKALNDKSNQLAYHLRNNGVKADTVVSLMLDRSMEMVIGILAILKAGGAYMPIDPDTPPKRLQYLLDDSQSKVLLTDTESNQDKERLVINLLDNSIYEDAIANLERDHDSNNLAYIIYTSGSTGKPKGVMLEHKGVVNRIEWMKNQYNFSEKEVVLQKTTYNFDVSVWEFFMTLCYGAKLVLCKKEVISNVDLLVETIHKEQISTLHFVPSMLNVFLMGIRKDEQGKLKTLKNVFASGEALSQIATERFHQLLNAKLHNLYGPTEASIDVTYFETAKDDQVIPIGKPIWNTQLYILDESQNVLPIGIPGELHIGGIGLARGYMNNPKLTADKFIENPFDNGKRLYKTGDLARWLPDGDVEFLGRLDFQVKIRGYRIELGDIESQLIALETVNEAVVVDKEQSDGSKYLCAYLTTSGKLNIAEIKEQLSEELPDYMIPAYIVQLDQMPLNLSGKLNRNALPEPDESHLEKDKYQAPSTKMERKLVQLWQQIFELEEIGINDNFFSIGGDSIKTIQLSALLLKDKLKLEVAKLFQYPTIKKLAPQITKSVLDISQDRVEGEVQLTPVQMRFFEKKYSALNHYNQAVMLEQEAGVDIEVLENVLQKIVRHHDALRLVYKQRKKEEVQLYSSTDENLTIEVIDLTQSNNLHSDIQQRATQVQSSFNLRQGPLFKSVVFQTEKKDYVLLVAHHLLVDAVSWRIIIEDLIETYSELLKGKVIPLQDKTHSYQHWAKSLYNYAQDPAILKELVYWKTQEEISVKPLPVDFKGKEIKSSRTHEILFSKIETSALLLDTNKLYDTEINDILISALGLAVKKWSGHNKTRLNLEGHGRENMIESIEVSRTVGWFTAIFPVVVDASHSELSETIKATRAYLKQIPNKGVGYGILRYLVDANKKEGLTFKDNAEIVFNYLGQLNQSTVQENKESKLGMTLSSMPVGESISSQNIDLVKLNISGIITNEQLRISFEFSPEMYKEKTIESLALNYQNSLRDILAHCTDKKNVAVFENDSATILSGLETLITTPIFPLKDNSVEKNIFFFPPAIGFSMIYQELANQIANYNCYGVNFLISEDRIEQYVKLLVEINGDKPFIFVGYSGGANLAYQVGKAIEEKGHTISDIIMFDGMREINKTHLSDDEIQTKVFEYIGEEEGHPSHQLLKTKPERDRVRKIVESYQRYLSEVLDDGKTKVNIHQIESIEDFEEGKIRKERWKEVTSGNVLSYQGFGEHRNMLTDENLFGNFQILDAILKQL